MHAHPCLLTEAINALKKSGAPLLETSSQQTESERWEKDPEHQKTIEFYSQFIKSYLEANVLDLGAGSGKVTIRIAHLDNVKSIIAYDMSLVAMAPLIEGIKIRIENESQLEKIQFLCDGQPWQLPFDNS